MNTISGKKIAFHCKLALKDLNNGIANYWNSNRSWIIASLCTFPIIIFSLPFLIAAIATNKNHTLLIPTILGLSLIPSSISYIFANITRTHFHCESLKVLPLPWQHWLIVKSIYYGKLYSAILIINGIAIISLLAKLPFHEALKPVGLILVNIACTLVICDLTARNRTKWITGFMLIAIFSLLIYTEHVFLFTALAITAFTIFKARSIFSKSFRFNFLIKERLIPVILATAVWLTILITDENFWFDVFTIFLISVIFHEVSQTRKFIQLHLPNFIFMPFGEKTLKKFERQALFFYLVIAFLIAFTSIVLSGFSPPNVILLSASLAFGIFSILLTTSHMIFAQGVLVLLYVISSLS